MPELDMKPPPRTPAEALGGFTFGLRKGIIAAPRTGDDTAKWWVTLANNGDREQRMSAFIILLQMGVGVEVRLITSEGTM